MQVRPSAVLKGAATFVPGAMKFACGGSGGTNSARYCYSTWLRHLIKLHEAGIEPVFDTVAELGPGDSLGIGLSAMLTGVSRYFAFDALPHARTSSNLETLDQLVALFGERSDLPDRDEFPEIWPPVPSVKFPASILGNGRVAGAMEAARVTAIRAALERSGASHVELRYYAPWHDAALVQPGSVDLVFSQAVLEHVEDIDATYSALFRWLKAGGVMSHQIDFRSHSLTRDWFGHWTVAPWLWRVVKGRRPYLINRLPASAHLDAMARHGFEIVQLVPQQSFPAERRQLASEFRGLSDEDLRTSSLYVIARKPDSSRS